LHALLFPRCASRAFCLQAPFVRFFNRILPSFSIYINTLHIHRHMNALMFICILYVHIYLYIVYTVYTWRMKQNAHRFSAMNTIYIHIHMRAIWSADGNRPLKLLSLYETLVVGNGVKIHIHFTHSTINN